MLKIHLKSGKNEGAMSIEGRDTGKKACPYKMNMPFLSLSIPDRSGESDQLMIRSQP